MKKMLFVFLLFFLFPFQVFAFETSASSAILMDRKSGRILYSKNMHQVRSVASISKIMTAILALESGKANEEVTIGEEVLKSYGSGIYIHVGEHMKLKDLVYGLMLRSGNDAAYSIASYVSGNVENFVLKMNEKAKEIGMKNTIFHNPNGLEEEGGNLSTAYDMALLTCYAMKNEDYREIVKTKKHKVTTDFNTYSWTNKNKMLSLYSLSTGGKTGYTEVAKRTLVSTASKDGFELVAVTLNDGNDWNDHKNLFEEAYNTYQNYQILKKGTITIPGETYYLNSTFSILNDYFYPLKESELESISITYELEKKKTGKVGEAIIFLGEEEIHREEIYLEAKKEKKKSFLEKVKAWFRNLW